MKNFLTLLFLVFSTFVFGQLSFDLGIGYNRFTNNYNDYIRTNGVTSQFRIESELSDIFSLSYGMDISLAQEHYISYYYPRYIDENTGELNIDFSKIIEDKSTNYSISTQFPVTLVTAIINRKLFLLSGLSLNIDNFFIFGDAFSGSDPEIYYPPTPFDYYLHPWPQGRLIGLGSQIGILYRPLERMALYCEWKTTKNKTFSYNYLEIGVKFRLFVK